MTKIATTAVLLASLMAGSAFADDAVVTDTQMSAIGLAGFQPMTDSQASTVRGKSYGSYSVQAGVNGGAVLGPSGVSLSANASANNSYKTATAAGVVGVVAGAAAGSVRGGGVAPEVVGGGGVHFVVVGVIVGGFATANVH